MSEILIYAIAASEVNQTINRQPSFSREISQVLEIRRREVQAVKRETFTAIQ